MKWTPEQIKTLHEMYAADFTYAEICKALNRTMASIRCKIGCDLAQGKMRGLTGKRFKTRLAMQQGTFSTYEDNGHTVKLYPPRYAQGCSPQVGAIAKENRQATL